MPKGVKVSAAKPGHQRWVWGAHIVDDENQLPKAVL